MTKTNLTKVMPERIVRYGVTDLCPLEGDTPVLQFINTLRDRGSVQLKEYLKNYTYFLNWCYEIRLIDWDAYNILELEAYCSEHEAKQITTWTVLTREMLYSMVTNMMNGEPPYPLSIKEFNRLNGEANNRLHFEFTERGFEEVWIDIDEELWFPLWRLIKYATDFFTSGDMKYVRKCKCGSFFLDRTKNKTRRYCNPITCGSAARSKGYYARKLAVMSGQM